ncbi:MAG: hypothetical protein AAFX06_14860 [Planctomycetota bacterium]
MIKDALEYIFKTASRHANRKPEVESPRGRFRYITIDGKREIEELRPVGLEHSSHSLSSINDLIEQFGGDKPTVYVAPDGVRVLLDNNDREEWIAMQFEKSPQALALAKLADGVGQKELIKTLRTDLAGCYPTELFLPIVRNLTFNAGSTAQATREHGRDSLGSTVDRTVAANAGDIPEVLRFQFPLYTVPHDVVTDITLECAIDIDMDSGRISVIPTGDTLAREEKRILNEIVGQLDALVEDKALVVLGEVSTQSTQ